MSHPGRRGAGAACRAIYSALTLAPRLPAGQTVVVNRSGRGDLDLVLMLAPTSTAEEIGEVARRGIAGWHAWHHLPQQGHQMRTSQASSASPRMCSVTH